MTQDEHYPERGYNTDDVAALRSEPPKKSFRRRHWGKLLVAAIILIPAVGITLWTAIALGYSYSSGERVGYLNKFSRKGWLCKTYEGEISMVNLPGQLAGIFQFTVRDDSIAALINKAQGQRVAVSYTQHKGLPTSCFGETDYFVKGIKVLGQ
jgi:hypothetical protein